LIVKCYHNKAFDLIGSHFSSLSACHSKREEARRMRQGETVNLKFRSEGYNAMELQDATTTITTANTDGDPYTDSTNKPTADDEHTTTSTAENRTLQLKTPRKEMQK